MWHRRALVRLAGALIAAVGLIVLTAGPSLAGGPAVVLQAARAADSSWQLQARLTDTAGAPVGGSTVQFAAQETFMGASVAVPIGTATTDTTGIASIRYVPTWNGPQVLEATASGSAAASSAPVTIEVSGALSAIPLEAANLPTISAVAGPAAVVLALTVWLALALTLLYTVLGVARPELGWRPRPMRITPRAAESDDAHP